MFHMLQHALDTDIRHGSH